MKKVLHILNTSSFSGAENVVCQIINMFKDDPEIEMYYCSPQGNIKETLEKKGIIYIPVKELTARELDKVIYKLNPDIIHAHDVRASIVTLICKRKCKFICTIHGNDIRMRKLSQKSLSSFLALKKAEHIFWVSNSCLDEYVFKKNVMKKSSVLPNVIDKNELIEKIYKDGNSYEFDVVYLGRISQEKNPKRLLNVLELVCYNNKKLKAAIVGDGPLFLEIKKEIEIKGLEENIVCMGFMENPMKLLSQAKILVMTSDWEGTPMCVLEAMALGIPIVSTPTDGIVNLIENDISGYLSFDVNILAKKINEFVDDEVKWKYLSDNISKKFEEINNVERYKRQLKKYYE